MIEADPQGTSDHTALGYAVGGQAANAVPLVSGLARRPGLDELDALGVGMATSGGVAMFVLPGVTPPFAEDDEAGTGLPEILIDEAALSAVYEEMCSPEATGFDIVHLGCPHASFEEMKHYAAPARRHTRSRRRGTVDHHQPHRA